MPKLSRLGDRNSDGGKILGAAKTVFCNGIPVGLHLPSPISGHGPGIHRGPKSAGGSPTVFAEGIRVLRITSPCTDGNPIAQGSNDTYSE